jgi:hypothetical protein
MLSYLLHNLSHLVFYIIQGTEPQESDCWDFCPTLKFERLSGILRTFKLFDERL